MVLSRFVTGKRQCLKPATRILQNFVNRMSGDSKMDNKIQFASFRERLEQMKVRTAVKIEFRPPNYASALVPTLHSDSFDPQGRKVHPWVILKLFDHLDMSWPQYRELPTPGTPDTGIYVLKLQVDINPEFYHMDSPLHPLLLESRMLFLKRSSRSFLGTIQHPDLVKPYATVTTLDVNVNLETRRPTPFPDSWRHESIPNEGNALEFDIPAKPPNTIKRQRQVYQSDNDENGHMNYTSYIRFCHDAFVDNLSEGKYSQNAAEHQEAGVKQMQVVFKSECLRGDILDIECWEDRKERGTYHFEMSKEKELVVGLTLRFFSISEAGIISKM